MAKDLKAKLEKTQARLQELQARKKIIENRIAETTRRNERRRQLVVGKMVLAEAMANEKVGAWLAKKLDSSLSRDADRQLFADLLTASQGKAD